MIIDCISDLHGHFPVLDGGDLLIVAGDLTSRDQEDEHIDFMCWLSMQSYKKKIFIAGNHDNQLVGSHPIIFGDCEYLCDSGTEFEGLKIWGSPWTKTFEGMNPHCKAFTLDDEEELAKKWTLIPDDVDILITHSPPFSILDMTNDCYQVGSIGLMAKHLAKMKPKLWVWGHIHEAYGKDKYDWSGTQYVNASHVNCFYQPVNQPIRIEL
jgi:Icc-related predicted phosphoesterase